MASMIQRHKFGCVLVVAAVLLALTPAALPWKSLLENKLKGFLETRGFTQVQMTVSDASSSGLVLKDIAFKTNDFAVSASEAAVIGSINANEKRWEGQWEIQDIQIANSNTQIPVLNGAGTLSLELSRAIIDGQFGSADNATRSIFNADYSFAKTGKSALTVTEFVMPWSGGKLSAKDIRIPLGKKAPIDIYLEVDKVSADALMQQFTGKRATATGTISGTLPVAIMPEGGIVFRNGQLQADAEGILAVSPDVIPGDNEQVAVVREILKDFHYTSFSLKLNSDKENQVEMQLNLEGGNPQVQNGRAVKINVNLTGDVLGFAQQNLLWLTDPKKIIERGKNAEP